MRTPFKMKGMSFGNSPLHDHKKDKDGNVIKHKKKTKEKTYPKWMTLSQIAGEKEWDEYYKLSEAYTSDTTGTVTMPTMPKKQN